MKTTLNSERKPDTPPLDLPAPLSADQREVIRMLGLTPTPGATDGSYSRAGYTGRFHLQTEKTGATSVWYSGGTDEKGNWINKQTFFHMPWVQGELKGQWRADFPEPSSPPPLEKKAQLAAEDRIISELGLTKVEGAKNGAYSKNGYKGSYFLQREPNGEYSVWYSGGNGPAGQPIAPQTYIRGRWVTAIGAPISEALIREFFPAQAAIALLPKK